MVQKSKSLKQLQREVAMQKARIQRIESTEKLEAELKSLRRSQKTGVSARIGRGFRALSKRAGRLAVSQARLIRERQIKQSKTIKKRSKGFEFDPLGSLDI